MTFWKKGGKVIVDDKGKPILCDHCPCDVCVPYTPPSTITVNIYNVIVGGYDENGPYNCNWGDDIEDSYQFKLYSVNPPNTACNVTATYYRDCPEYGDMQTLIHVTFTSAGKFHSYSFGDDACGIGIDSWAFPDSIQDKELDYGLCDIVDAGVVRACRILVSGNILE